MSIEKNVDIVEEYRNELKMLVEIKEMAEHLSYANRNNFDVRDPIEKVIENAGEAIIQLAKEFAENDLLEDEEENEKLGYAFTWLKKLQSAENDDVREEILKDWLKEISDSATFKTACQYKDAASLLSSAQ